MDILQRLREAQADTKRDMKRTDLRTKDILLLSDMADVFGECGDEIESLRQQLAALGICNDMLTDEMEYERGKRDGWEACETCHGIVGGKLPAGRLSAIADCSSCTFSSCTSGCKHYQNRNAECERERDANAAYFEEYHQLRVAVNAAYPQDPYQLAIDVPSLMQEQLADMTKERDELITQRADILNNQANLISEIHNSYTTNLRCPSCGESYTNNTSPLISTWRTQLEQKGGVGND